MFRKLLVPIDNSEVSLGILPYVGELSKSLGAPVVLLSVVDPLAAQEQREIPAVDPVTYHRAMPLINFTGQEGFYEVPPSGRPYPVERPVTPIDVAHPEWQYPYQAAERVISQVETWLSEQARPLQGQGVEVEIVAIPLADGLPELILDVAAQKGCDLIAMATHGRSLVGQAIQGSVTNEIIRIARAPIFAVAPELGDGNARQPITLSRVLAPLDGSPFSEGALPYVEELARRLDLEVVLIQEVEKSANGAAVEQSDRYLGNIASRMEAKSIKVRYQVGQSELVPSIAQSVKGDSQTMVALISHARSGIAHWLLGNVAGELLRETEAPVLIIPEAAVESIRYQET